ncbi:hypothetical protein [Corynebacterium glutamicum]|uniref:8-oxoguanine DNA glycosylase OGG fold protein n=1 Tax=Corynebacterium glutamicum TaxID=1718 RepID=UPI000943ED39|nr:hypothetical protein [Corynebacterium glutamicum]OKX79787.1 hypothetical protein AUO95_11335 [Corynebacterium glutamicum]
MPRYGHTIDAILKALGPDEDAPTPEKVRGQWSRFYPEQWRKRWLAPHDDSPTSPAFLSTQERQLSVSRDELFDLGQQINSEDDAVAFYVAVCAWGAGPSARDTSRRVKVLMQPDAPQRLYEGLTQVDLTEPVDGYRAFNAVAVKKIKGLGPAYFTKLLHFRVGRPDTSGKKYPLILDSRVAKALGWSKTTDWTSSEYSTYLDLIDAVHQRWRPDLPADIVEYQLFMSVGTKKPPSITDPRIFGN